MATATTKGMKRAGKAGAIDFVPRVLMPFRRGETVEWMVTARHVPLGVPEILALLDDPRVVDRAPLRLELPARRTVPKARGGWAAGDADAAALAESSALARFRELSIPDAGIGPDGVRALATSPHLAGLRVLDLTGNPLGDDGLAALAGARFQELEELLVGTGEDYKPAGATGLSALARALPRLSLLDLAGHAVAPHAGLLAGAAFAGSLRSLSLRATGVLDAAAAGALGAGRLGEALASLDLRATEVGPAALAALCDGSWPALRKFSWIHQPDHREKPGAAIAALAKLPALAEIAAADALAHDHFRALLETDLSEKLEVVDRLGAYGDLTFVLAAVFERPWPKLRRLTLEGGGDALRSAKLPALTELVASELQPEGARALVAADAPSLRSVRLSRAFVASGLGTLLGGLSALEELSVYGDRIDASAFTGLDAAPAMRTTKRLRVGGAKLDAAAVAALVRLPWVALEELAIDNNPAAGRGGLDAILASQHAPRLRALDVSETGVDAGGAAAIASAPLGSLRALALRRSHLEDAGVEALAGATGLSELRYLDLRKTPMSVAAAATLAGSTALRALEEIDLGVDAPVKAQTVEAPPHRLVGQGRVGRTDPGVDRVDARYG